MISKIFQLSIGLFSQYTVYMHILFSFLCYLAFLFFCQIVQAQVFHSKGISITIDQAKIQKSLIAMPHFQGQSHAVGRVLYNTIHNNLDINSFFQLIKPEAFLENPVPLTPYPSNPDGFKFENWKIIGAEFLIRGSYRILNDRLYFESYVYHVPQTQLIFKKTYQSQKNQVRWVAHAFSNDLFKALTGQEGMFLSQVVMTSDRSGGKWKEIYVMDWDGHNMKKITRHRSISMSPSWSPDGKSVAYSVYTLHKRRSHRFTNLDLLHLNLTSQQRQMLSGRRGINSGSVFHPGGRFVFFTLTRRGSADIFRIDTKNRKSLKRVTKGPYKAMNVEPSMSPDGKKIVFSSDRSGRPMIYTMNVNGSQVKRLTYAGHYNSSPSWSPNGKWIAFAGYQRGYYDIFVIRPNGTELKRLTNARGHGRRNVNNEEPTFSPDSKHIMFVSDRTGKKQLYVIGIDGTNEKRITSDHYNYYKPKWGPSISMSY